MSKIMIPLTNSQVMILKTLARNPNGLTREDLAEKSGVVVDNSTLGPVYDDTLSGHPDSLRAHRMVIVQRTSPDAPTLYRLTAAGIQAASDYSSRKIGAKIKVDPSHLDKAVMQIRALKPYGLELLTEDDVKEIRTLLPEEYQEVTTPDLRQQIVNRRKQGAYVVRTSEPQWYIEYRDSSEGKLFAARVLEYYGGTCTLCLEIEEVRVYHRILSDLGNERIKDGIALCHQCRKRQGRFMCQIPPTNPQDEQ